MASGISCVYIQDSRITVTQGYKNITAKMHRRYSVTISPSGNLDQYTVTIWWFI